MTSIDHEGIKYRPYDDLYAVSRCGKLLRKFTPSTPRQRPDGYLEAGSGRLVHRMVAACWIKKPDGAKLVHHRNGIKHDNRASNLEWTTQQEHMGTHHPRPRGVYHMSEEGRASIRAFRTGRKDSKLTRAKKAAILSEVRHHRTCTVDGVTYYSIPVAARALGMHQSTVRQRCLSKYFPNYKLV